MRVKFVTFDFVDMLHIKQSENESVNSPHTSDWCAYTNTSKTKKKQKKTYKHTMNMSTVIVLQLSPSRENENNRDNMKKQ